MTDSKLGHIVWHDLFTTDADASRAFYTSIAHWDYMIEHATDFAWGGGERDFILAMLNQEAGAGFVTIMQPEHPSGWVPYIEVEDVDATAQRAEDLGGSIEKPPFEVPGVGRNCLLRDPQGARFGICLSRHSFPRPRKQFGPEAYCAPSGACPVEFYTQLLRWQLRRENGTSFFCQAGEPVALLIEHNARQDGPNIWSPSVRVSSLSDAKASRSDSVFTDIAIGSDTPCHGEYAMGQDPTGALILLCAPA